MSVYWNEYENWLVQRVGFLGHGHYNKLMDCIHMVDFWVDPEIPRDHNREEDGRQLRQEFLRETGLRPDTLDRYHVSVLEVLAALAIRMENEYIGDPADPHPENIFWEMIGNLDLHQFSDPKFDEYRVRHVLNSWMLRKYDDFGRGGIFPLQDTSWPDQRGVEIWSQMNAYLTENY